MRNHSNENEFYLHENGPVGETHFHLNGFARRLDVKQRQRVTRKWPILLCFLRFLHLHPMGKTHLHFLKDESLDKFGCLFHLHVHFHANQSHFHLNAFARRLVLKSRQKATRKWPLFLDVEVSFRVAPQAVQAQDESHTTLGGLNCVLFPYKNLKLECS